MPGDPPIWITEFGDWRSCTGGEGEECLPGSDEAKVQATNLDLWYNMIERPDFDGSVSAMLWFSHHKVTPPDHPDQHFGLMNDEADIVDADRWLSWRRLLLRTPRLP